MKLDKSLVIFVFSAVFLLLLLAVGAGFYLGTKKGFPGTQIKQAIRVGRGFVETGVIAPEGLLSRRPEMAPEEDYLEHDAARMPRGYRAMMRFDLTADLYVVDLFDPAGDLVWTWRLDDPAAGTEAAREDRIQPHGLVILESGDVVINGVAESKILARYDRCSIPVWSLNSYYHHLMSRDEVKGIWSWLTEGRDAYSQNQFMVRFDPETGQELERISAIKDLVQAHPENQAILNLPSYYFEGERRPWERRDTDLLHTNDVEALPAALADKFPDFQPGDLLVSFRNYSMIAVIDRITHKIKWRMQGPWIHQHDPDFTEDGRISVFNNNFTAPYERRSNIITVDPQTMQTQTLFESPETVFFSDRMGEHQSLPGGILHITVPHEGRVIEIDPKTDELVFEYNNRVLKGHNAHIANSVWLPEEYFNDDPKSFACPG